LAVQTNQHTAEINKKVFNTLTLHLSYSLYFCPQMYEV
jgi:hypothetical protein